MESALNTFLMLVGTSLGVSMEKAKGRERRKNFTHQVYAAGFGYEK